MNYNIKEWKLQEKKIYLNFQYENWDKSKTWIVRIIQENLSETRLYKSRNAAMNYIRNLIKN